jgi:DNA-binding GntR family transcriptional regulator
MLVGKVEKPRYAFLSSQPNGARGRLAADVESALRAAILNLKLEPGAMLEKQAICDQLGVSRSPVSAAMARLAAEGLVEVLPQRGTRVTRIALEDIREHLFIRGALEAETVFRIAAQVSDEVLSALDVNLAQQEHAMSAGQVLAFHALDLQFHEILLNALALPRVKAVVSTARNSLDRARRLMASPIRLRETYKEHAKIVRALHLHDPERASRTMRTHLESVAAELHRFARRRPDLFE